MKITNSLEILFYLIMLQVTFWENSSNFSLKLVMFTWFKTFYFPSVKNEVMVWYPKCYDTKLSYRLFQICLNMI